MGQLDANDAYILDSNSFIAPFRNYYSMEHFPSYWNWLKDSFSTNPKNLILPKIVYDELTTKSDDELSEWVKSNLQPYVYDESHDTDMWLTFQKVLNFIQTSGYYIKPGVDDWLKEGKADPQLVALAVAHKWKVVTFEESAGVLNKNTPMKKEPKIPDICDHFGVECVNLYLIEEKLQLVI